jgi:hypothetical protein
MNGRSSSLQEAWAGFALEQARIIVEHLEEGGRDPEFLVLHAMALLQSIDLEVSPIAAPIPTSARYVA